MRKYPKWCNGQPELKFETKIFLENSVSLTEKLLLHTRRLEFPSPNLCQLQIRKRYEVFWLRQNYSKFLTHIQPQSDYSTISET